MGEGNLVCGMDQTSADQRSCQRMGRGNRKSQVGGEQNRDCRCQPD
jgi:hypothetical protein